MADKQDRTEFYVGLFVFFGLVLLGTLILTFGGITNMFRNTYPITVIFGDVLDLREGAPVRRGGTTIGRINEDPTLTPEFSNVSVPLKIYEEFKIPMGSGFKISTAGLMGDTFINVIPPEEAIAGFIASGQIVSGNSTSGLDQLPETVDAISKETIAVLRDIREGLGSLNTALAKIDEQVLTAENIENTSTTISRLNSIAIKLEERYVNEVNAVNINETLTTLRIASQKLAEIIDAVPPLINETTNTVKRIGPSVEKFSDEATETAEAFQQLAATLEKLIEEFRESDGAIPMLLNDPQIAEDIKAIIHNHRKHGFLFHKDSFDRDKREGTADPGSQPQPKERKIPFWRKLRKPKGETDLNL
jgi:phospholipid/cholesterol/gamma-HCH transport system substrate-binding protein